MTEEVCTIGFAKKSLKGFVELLQINHVRHLIDTRLNNTSQLAGFAKRDDLQYVMKLVDIKYSHQLQLAPESQMLEDYKKKRINWSEYEEQYLTLLKKRKVEQEIEKLLGDGKPCFLCSEDKPHYCHRRLLVEYLQDFQRDIKVIHLT